jgi:hypothetical protein
MKSKHLGDPQLTKFSFALQPAKVPAKFARRCESFTSRFFSAVDWLIDSSIKLRRINSLIQRCAKQNSRNLTSVVCAPFLCGVASQ